ncbi:hypothetical protein [Rickettsia endosymbiont of Ceutorhynchus obstrictus]|uniref:hypothetical protein n=1 Tax=Rickettsia endosymbiont of Ceutorhynchus obstrictus TaxID=3066249 RepID=UPI003132DB74
MLNFNHKNVSLNAITEQVNKHIDMGLWFKHQMEPARKYLGASRLGMPCSRALQYEYMAAENNESYPLDGQTLRIFETGHVFEELAIRWLRFSGFRLDTRDENGQQFGFKAAHGKIAGHVDGIITGIPLTLTLKLPCPMLWEVKTMNGKNWRETVNKGLVLSKPVYAAQIALYQAYMEETITGISKNPCLFTAINKDTSELYHELIPFDTELAQRMSDKAVNIIKSTEAGETLPRGFSSKEVFDCKICPYQTKCWGD